MMDDMVKKSKMVRSNVVFNILATCLVIACSNSFFFIKAAGKLYILPILVMAFLLVNILPIFLKRDLPSFRLRICHHGVTCLNVFWYSAAVSAVCQVILAFSLLPDHWLVWLWSLVICFCAEAVVFWNGMISVYGASVQLGIRHRAVGLACGFIPVVNLILLRFIVKTVSAEIDFEAKKSRLDQVWQSQEICGTKYPVLLVHGVFFRDFKYFNYWGRIPDALKNNGAQVFYGNHQSAASVSACAEELTARIIDIVKETHCNKVNIIAHSKGGLDSRYAISLCGAAPYIASLTTVNTPHRGCEFADYLLNKAPEKVKNKLAKTYNSTLKRLGDRDPDFLAAVSDLTASGCLKLNEAMEDTPNTHDIFCQSVGSKLNRATSGKFPLNFTYPLVKYFDGPNDGLVSETSFEWGDSYTFLTVTGKRGISHGDMVDLNRENIPQFDVREFFVQLVAGLKEKGL